MVDTLFEGNRPRWSKAPSNERRCPAHTGLTEAINGRLEHLRGTASGFRNLTNYIVRSLLETRGFRPQLHPRL
jgi:transposase